MAGKSKVTAVAESLKQSFIITWIANAVPPLVQHLISSWLYHGFSGGGQTGRGAPDSAEGRSRSSVLSNNPSANSEVSQSAVYMGLLDWAPSRPVPTVLSAGSGFIAEQCVACNELRSGIPCVTPMNQYGHPKATRTSNGRQIPSRRPSHSPLTYGRVDSPHLHIGTRIFKDCSKTAACARSCITT